ncbi:MAG: hypothetical protein ACTSP5_06505, partial [Candidatus Heimdallarchaeota archaeon]
SETYRLPTNQDYIGQEAIVFVKVNSKGGIVRVELKDQLFPLKLPAKTVYKDQEFLPDEIVFVVNVEKSYLIVDDTQDILANTKLKEKKIDDEDN